MEILTNKSKKYFVKERRLLRIFGISFKENESTAYKIYAFVMVGCTNFMYPVLQFRELFKHDKEVVSDMLVYVFGVYVALFKTIAALRNRILIGRILDRLEKEPFTVNLQRGGVEEEKLNERCLWITNTQTIVYWVACYATLFISIGSSYIKSLLKHDGSTDIELPFGPVTILNVTNSFNFEITRVYQSICLLFAATHFATIDILMAAVLAHVSYQFKMLQNCLRRITANCYIEMQKDKSTSALKNEISDDDFDASEIPWKYLHGNLTNIIQYHLEITNLTDDMEEVFSKLLLMEFLGTLGLLCFSVYRLSVVQDNMKVLIHTAEALSTCLQVLTVSYWGEQVVFESQQVGRAAYEANFVGADLRFQKGLALIIRRSQNPIKLTAGKFADICLATFTWVMRASYSACMVVRSRS